MDHHHLPINCEQLCVNIPDILSPEHLLSKELTRKMPFHPLIVVYNHCTCVEFFACYTSFGIWDMVKDTSLWGTNCWLLIIIIKIMSSRSGLPIL